MNVNLVGRGEPSTIETVYAGQAFAVPSTQPNYLVRSIPSSRPNVIFLPQEFLQKHFFDP
jgi:hypothetical protein